MREIIFRGKKIYGGDWIAGDLLHNYVDGGDAWIWIDRDDIIPGYNQFAALGGPDQVVPETVGQFTGLTDMNGGKIFEGDVIMIRFEEDAYPECSAAVWAELAKVIYSTDHHGWYAVFANGEEVSMWEYDDMDGVVVVGNVYDNPELLEVNYCA